MLLDGSYERISDSAPACQDLYRAYPSLEFGRAVAALCEANPNLRVVYAIDVFDRENVLHFGEEVRLAKVAPLQPSQPGDVQALLEKYLGGRASSDVDWRRAAERLTGPPALACLCLRFMHLRKGVVLTPEKLEAVLCRAESEYRKELGQIFNLHARYNQNSREALLQVWGELKDKEVKGIVALPETRLERWAEVEALGIFTPERVGEGDVIRVYPCLKGLLDKLQRQYA